MRNLRRAVSLGVFLPMFISGTITLIIAKDGAELVGAYALLLGAVVAHAYLTEVAAD